ncbi:MAG: YgjP-like metallopeptidase domain-containing protein [Candidatus Woesearchaeota archaeon]
MDLLEFLKKKSSHSQSYSQNDLIINNSSYNPLHSLSTSYKKESKEEFILKLEQDLNFKMQKKEHFDFLVKLMLCDKKHSSARYKHPFIEIRLSKYNSKKILEDHSKFLISKLLNKLDLKKSKFPSISHKNSTHEFIKSIQRGYFYVANYKINLVVNSTKTVIKIEKNTNRKYFNELDKESNEKLNEITVSLPNINRIKNIFLLKDNSEIYIQNLKGEELSLLKKVEHQVAKCLCSYFQKFIQDKVIELNLKTLKSPLNEISLNYVHSKWGHCTSKNDIMLHISLLNSNLNVFEYVIYHELAHTIEKNHSQTYWKICNSLTPHTIDARNYLKNSPPILFMEHPNLEIKLY